MTPVSEIEVALSILQFNKEISLKIEFQIDFSRLETIFGRS